jgi:hypothetical protein
MNASIPACRAERRRHEVRRRQHNGLDYVEVSDDQRRLTVYFLGAAPRELNRDNFEIRGGQRIRGIRILDLQLCEQRDPELDNCIVLTVDRPGDFATYSLCLVNLPADSPFDPRYRCAHFGFKAACPSELDCGTVPACPPEPRREPEIGYLAKDYASFRRLILDRMATVMPDWTDHHVPDIGITLVELFAYVGDHLSYHQDAVATEAYLGTARQRVSVRRHARLVDYLVHEGCNARAWVHVQTSSDVTLSAARLFFATGFDDAPDVGDRLLTPDDLRGIPRSRYEVFEPLLDEPDGELRFFQAHNRIRIYTWGDTECCLPRGATSATLVDGPRHRDREPDGGDDGSTDPDPSGENTAEDAPRGERDTAAPAAEAPTRALHLRLGDVIILEEVIGPRTGVAEDADPAHRHAVRLTRVVPAIDELFGQPLLEVGWAEEDALPFALCLSVVGPAPGCRLIPDVGVARGNVVLVDHGRRLAGPEELGCVPLGSSVPTCEREGRPSDVVRHPGRFRPRLAEGPLTFSQPLPARASATRLLDQDPRRALPWIRLSSRPDPRCDGKPEVGGEGEPGDGTPNDEPWSEWSARYDLLGSRADDRHHVVEMDDRRRAHLRFGDGELGRRPDAGLAFRARYRVGNGRAGNVGADTVVLAVYAEVFSGVILRPRNPLPARGGTEPEPVAEVKWFAPHAFRQVLERATTAADYARLAEQHPEVDRAVAELRWNGSWFEVRVAIDPVGRTDADASLLHAVETHLYRFRRIGHDVAVRPAHYVPLELALRVCVEPAFLRGHVLGALLDLFRSSTRADGAPGFFHPDRLTFGQPVSVSRIVAEAHAVPGVESVAVTRLQRLFQRPAGEIEQGVLPIGPLEIARLDNDPSFPENGGIRFDMRGGR